MKYLFSLIYFLNSNLALGSGIPVTENSIFIPKPEIGRISLATPSYADLRIDYNLDGKIDYWFLRKDSLLVEIYFEKGLPSLFTGRSIQPRIVREFGYRLSGNTFKLIYNNYRLPLQLNYDEDPSEKARLCQEKLKDIKSQLTSFSKQLDEEVILNALEKDLVDDSCADEEDLNDDISFALDRNDTIGKCLTKDGKFRKSIPPGADNDLAVEILSAQYELQKRQLVEHSNKFGKTFRCQPSSPPKQGTASTTEGGEIIFFTPLDLAKQKEIIQHELLHRAGAISEDLTKKVVAVCLNNEKGNPVEIALDDKTKVDSSKAFAVGNIAAATENSSKEMTADTSKVAGKSQNIPVPTKKAPASGTEVATTKSYDAVSTATKSSSATIPKELTLAQASIPSSDALSSDIYNPPSRSDAGVKLALNNSHSKSSGVLMSANSLLGAASTPALAHELVQQKAAISNQVAGLKNSVTSSRAPANVDVAPGLKASQVGPKEKIVESITLNSQSSMVTPKAEANNQAQNIPKSTVDNRSLSEGKIDNVPETAGLNNSRNSDLVQVNPAGGSKVLLGGQPQYNQQQPSGVRARAIASTGVTTPSLNEEQEKSITFISHGDFNKTKQMLRDPNFAKKLEEQSITVLDRSGGSIGAKKGQILFLEKEDYFDRQK